MKRASGCRGTSLNGAASLSPDTKFGGGHWRSVAPKALTEAEGERHGVQFVSKTGISHGAGFKLRVDELIRVQQPLQICHESRSKSKKCDKQLTFIVRVISRLFCFGLIKCQSHVVFISNCSMEYLASLIVPDIGARLAADW